MLRAYLVYNTVVRLCQFLVVAGNNSQNENTFLRKKILLGYFIVIRYLLVFFIFEKQFASQDMFLVKSELSITAYFFLVLYRSTSLQSLSFLKNIRTFLCK